MQNKSEVTATSGVVRSQSTLPMRIGVDFDNTIINYDAIFIRAAKERGLIGSDFRGASKQAVRDLIRLLPDGEVDWQRLQGFVYGGGIAAAVMFDGVDRFLRRCRDEGVDVFVVSHKTEFGHHDPERVSLRDAARGWMTAHGFFREEGYAIRPENVFFEGTRQDKLARIAQIGATHFIDDLEEVLGDPAFPPGIERILFTAGEAASTDAAYIICPNWQTIEERVFRAPT